MIKSHGHCEIGVEHTAALSGSELSPSPPSDNMRDSWSERWVEVKKRGRRKKCGEYYYSTTTSQNSVDTTHAEIRAVYLQPQLILSADGPGYLLWANTVPNATRRVWVGPCQSIHMLYHYCPYKMYSPSLLSTLSFCSTFSPFSVLHSNFLKAVWVQD